MNRQSNAQAPQQTRSIKQFERLVGDWDMVGTHPGFAAPVHGHSSFEWFVKDALLLWHFDWERSGPPNAVSIIGHDDADEAATMLYSDVRGVARIYQMSLGGGIWKMWRESQGFSQRVTATFSDDGDRITAHGELSRDGSSWEQDLDVTYTRNEWNGS